MYVLRGTPEPDLKIMEKMKYFLVGHWKGVVIFITPLLCSIIIIPKGGATKAEGYSYCGFTLVLMATFWVSECIPLPVTAFFPLIVFPLSGVLGTSDTASCYIDNTIVMFIGSLMLAYSVEQSGLHKRIAYRTINIIGYSHKKLLLGICVVTTFVSLWITNTAATTTMVPVILAILNIFDKQGIINMYIKSEGERHASDITVCYFCCATYSATVGGLGTLIATATNLIMKGLYEKEYSPGKEVITFPNFSAFSIPYMIGLEIAVYICLATQYLGAFRPNSAIAKSTHITPADIKACKKAIAEEMKKMGKIRCHEVMVLILFGSSIVGFFCRSPRIFDGWGDLLNTHYGRPAAPYVMDSALTMFILFWMFLLPSKLVVLDNFKAKFYEQLPKGSVSSVLEWAPLNDRMPYSFMFLLGGGFAISTAASKTDLNAKLSNLMGFMTSLPHLVVVFAIVVLITSVTNFASNVAIAYIFIPIFMATAKSMTMSPLWACLATGFSTAHCFCLPVGTPGNLIVQGAAHIRTFSMIKCGFTLTICCIFITWFFVAFWAPVIWPIHDK